MVSKCDYCSRNRIANSSLFVYLLMIGKLGLGDSQLNRLVPTVVDGLNNLNIVKVASMSTYTIGINNQGSVYVWGTGPRTPDTSNSLNLLGGGAAANGAVGITGGAYSSLMGTISRTESSSSGLPTLLDTISTRFKIIDLSCGLGHALLLDTQGRVFAWGNGGNGRLGTGDTTDRSEVCLLAHLLDEKMIHVQCGASHSLALTVNGYVYSWGKNSQGQCGHGNMEDILKPTIIKKLFDIKVDQLAAGWEHSIALTNEGRLYSWGSGYKDSRRGIIPPVLGLGHSDCRPSPELLTNIEGIKITSITSGWDHCLSVDEHGKVLSWGSGQNGKLGHGNEDNITVPCYISALDKYRVIMLSAGCEHSAAITEDGELFTWGQGEGGRLGYGNDSPSSLPLKVSVISDRMNLR